MRSARDRAPRARFVHLGDRLLAIARLRAGSASVDMIAQEHDVGRDEVLSWLAAHSGDRVVGLDELRVPASAAARQLSVRVRRLSALIEDAERALRDLHQEYVLSLAASNDPFAK